MSTFYSLLLSKNVLKQLHDVRTQLFRQSKDSSFRTLEPWIILGETEDTTLRKPVSCPKLPLHCDNSARFQNQTLFLPMPEETFEVLRSELDVDHPYTGIYLGASELSCKAELFPIDDLRLALVEIQKAGPLTTWRILAEKHLQRDKGL